MTLFDLNKKLRYFMTKEYSPTNLPLPVMMLSGGIAGSIAEIATIPLDTAKVRLQIQGEKIKYTGLLNCVKTVIAEEGASMLFKGLTAGLQRQMVFASLRIGLYEPVRNFYVGQNHVGPISIWTRILAALTTGAFGIMVANPTDIVKIRFQAEGRKPQNERRYRTVTGAYKKIVQTEGVIGLWTGIGPNIIRNSIINAAEIATFDQIKDMLLRGKVMDDGIPCHLVSSAIAGFTATVVGSPVDVLKTRIMSAKVGEYSGVIDCVIKTFKEGPMAFYKGFQANAGRIVSWNIVMFVTLGQIRRLVYENSYKGVKY